MNQMSTQNSVSREKSQRQKRVFVEGSLVWRQMRGRCNIKTNNEGTQCVFVKADGEHVSHSWRLLTEQY